MTNSNQLIFHIVFNVNLLRVLDIVGTRRYCSSRAVREDPRINHSSRIGEIHLSLRN